MGTGGGELRGYLKGKNIPQLCGKMRKLWRSFVEVSPSSPVGGGVPRGGGVRGYPWLLLDLVMASG